MNCGYGLVAQWVERPAHNRVVGGSKPPEPTKRGSASSLSCYYFIIDFPFCKDRKANESALENENYQRQTTGDRIFSVKTSMNSNWDGCAGFETSIRKMILGDLSDLRELFKDFGKEGLKKSFSKTFTGSKAENEAFGKSFWRFRMKNSKPEREKISEKLRSSKISHDFYLVEEARSPC